MQPIDIGIVAVIIGMAVAAYRIMIGPSSADRGAGADVVFFGFVSLVALLGFRLGTDLVVDIVLVCTLVGFLSALSIARLISGGKR
ncbi:pesticidal protein Cry26Aa [Nocardiopsis sp. HNM0947]|uniref:Pesticidal protein Cry26Aa n=1 Tax=Nocardiopsis coralli TaxID=2772213 RepID=A0ABR9P3E6_9ACTN|nr:monovalent cation/H+ antiporter complex subunit F [Nocardiopsis coralli]MBE2998372.1 pesticidal protein Cry26Aa [Nocardiopsis coralli]